MRHTKPVIKRSTMMITASVFLLLLQLTTLDSIPENTENTSFHPSSTQSLVSTCQETESRNLTKITRDICSNISRVGYYILNITSMETLLVPELNVTHCAKNIFEQYNIDLKVLKNSCYSWTNLSNFDGLLQGALRKARAFETEFGDELLKYQTKVNIIVDGLIGEEMKTKITGLEEDIKDLNKAKTFSTSQTFSEYIASIIERKVNEIEKIKKIYQADIERRELEELVIFLEFQNTRITNIKNNTRELRSQISGFLLKVVVNSMAFKRYHNETKDRIKTLGQEINHCNNHLAEMQAAREMMNKAKLANTVELSELNKIASQSQRDLLAIENTLSRILDSARRKQKIAQFLSVLGVKDQTEDNPLANTSYQILANKKRTSIINNKKMIHILQTRLTSCTLNITKLQQDISNIEIKSHSLQHELKHCSNLDEHISSVETVVSSIVSKAANVVNEVSRLKGIFTALAQKIGDALQKAKEAKNASEKQHVISFIYTLISNIKCQFQSRNQNVNKEENFSKNLMEMQVYR